MNKNIGFSLCAGMVVAAGLLTSTSCSDTWDEHYNAGSATGVSTYDGTLYSYLESNAELSDFLEILQATGTEDLLNSEQVFTVWVPENNSFDKDSILNRINNGYSSDVVSRFVDQHIARYNYSLGGEEQDVTLLSEKVETMSDSATATIGGVKILSANEKCNNGVLHVIDGTISYLNNMYEQIADDDEAYRTAHPDEDTDDYMSLFKFLDAYDKDSLNESASVSRGYDENGNTIYVDSVLIHTNSALSDLNALIYEEDSSYIAIVPTPSAYKERHAEVQAYLNYNPNEADADTLYTYNANRLAANDLFFNVNDNEHYTDSLKATTYTTRTWEYNVFHHPFSEGGILSSYTSSVECSNGTIYNVDEWPVSIYDSFFRKITVEGESNNVSSSDVYTRLCNYSMYSIDETTDHVASTGVYVSPTTSAVNPVISYEIPNTFSGSYDIYVVIAPYWWYSENEADTLVANKFRVNLFEKNDNNTFFTTSGSAISAAKQFTNPEDGGRNYTNDVSNPYALDTIYVGYYDCNYCYYGGSLDAGIMLQIQSYVTSSENRSGEYTRNMLIDRIIFVPREQSSDDE